MGSVRLPWVWAVCSVLFLVFICGHQYHSLSVSFDEAFSSLSHDYTFFSARSSYRLHMYTFLLLASMNLLLLFNFFSFRLSVLLHPFYYYFINSPLRKFLLHKFLKKLGIHPKYHQELRHYISRGISSLQPIRSIGFFDTDPRRPIHWKDFSETTKINLPCDNARYLFKEYSPLVFQSIRQRFGITDEAFKHSLCSTDSLMITPTSGKSGSMFFFSADSFYVIKTMSHSESLFLRKILFSYYQHMMANPHSLLTWFLGHYRIERNGHKTHLVVMRNVFDSELKIHEEYDLKGSTFGP
ncbi:hypothetical protein P9112_004944 [Eukaryota sp. TZLM1-RC]